MAMNHFYNSAGGEDAGGNKSTYHKNPNDYAGGEDAGSNSGRVTYDTNNIYTEVEIDRKNTITLKVENKGRIRTEDLFAHLDYLNLLQHTECIQRLQDLDQNFEITVKEGTNLEDFQKILNQQEIVIDGQTLINTPTRKLRDIRKNPITKVLIFEAPFELEDRYILTKLSTYGILQVNTIYSHKYKGTEIYNGIRSVNFITIIKPIPTTIFVRGNRLKLKHEGQDRTPICGICKEKGHYRNECPRKETNIYTDRDNLEENREEQITWSTIVRRGNEQRKRNEDEQSRLYMDEIKKQEEQNKRKRR